MFGGGGGGDGDGGGCHRDVLQELYALIRKHVRKVERKSVDMHKLIGAGSFGEVFLGACVLSDVKTCGHNTSNAT